MFSQLLLAVECCSYNDEQNKQHYNQREVVAITTSASVWVTLVHEKLTSSVGTLILYATGSFAYGHLPRYRSLISIQSV